MFLDVKGFKLDSAMLQELTEIDKMIELKQFKLSSLIYVCVFLICKRKPKIFRFFKKIMYYLGNSKEVSR